MHVDAFKAVQDFAGNIQKLKAQSISPDEIGPVQEQTVSLGQELYRSCFKLDLRLLQVIKTI